LAFASNANFVLSLAIVVSGAFSPLRFWVVELTGLQQFSLGSHPSAAEAVANDRRRPGAHFVVVVVDVVEASLARKAE